MDGKRVKIAPGGTPFYIYSQCWLRGGWHDTSCVSSIISVLFRVADDDLPAAIDYALWSVLWIPCGGVWTARLHTDQKTLKYWYQSILSGRLDMHVLRQLFREGCGAMVRAWSIAIAAACRAVSSPAWCRNFRKIPCFSPLNIGTFVSMLYP